MSQSDSHSVTIIGRRAPRAGSSLKSDKDVAQAQRSGLAVSTEKKYEAGHNKQHAGPGPTAVKLDRETEELKHEKLDLSVSKVMQRARNDKN